MVYGTGEPCEVTVVLNSFKGNDYFATNLELTGYANWFGSINMCNMIGEDAQTLFPQHGCRLLELGSGTGRAGIMAAKTMAAAKCKGCCVLTDGEAALVDVLKQNCSANGLDDPGISCEQLWWGNNPTLDKLCSREPEGFDVIIGADLVYGPDAVLRSAVHVLYCTCFVGDRREVLHGFHETGVDFHRRSATPCGSLWTQIHLPRELHL